MNRVDVRELIRKAQSAEIAGEIDQAVDCLRQAAQAQLEAGESSRAASLLRHCVRLKPERPDLAALLARAEEAEQGAETPRGRARGVDVPQRGPIIADPAIDAWCSFCCRPKIEVGRLVAGPAGAFICGVCAATSSALLEVERGEAPERRPAVPEIRIAEPTAPETAAAGTGPDFIEAAVVLSRELGWGLTEVRSLSDEERARALAIVDRLRPRHG